MGYISVRVYMDTGYQTVRFLTLEFATRFANKFTDYKTEITRTNTPVENGFTFYTNKGELV